VEEAVVVAEAVEEAVAKRKIKDKLLEEEDADLENTKK
jgi:hypothetical protein